MLDDKAYRKDGKGLTPTGIKQLNEEAQDLELRKLRGLPERAIPVPNYQVPADVASLVEYYPAWRTKYRFFVDEINWPQVLPYFMKFKKAVHPYQAGFALIGHTQEDRDGCRFGSEDKRVELAILDFFGVDPGPDVDDRNASVKNYAQERHYNKVSPTRAQDPDPVDQDLTDQDSVDLDPNNPNCEPSDESDEPLLEDYSEEEEFGEDFAERLNSTSAERPPPQLSAEDHTDETVELDAPRMSLDLPFQRPDVPFHGLDVPFRRLDSPDKPKPGGVRVQETAESDETAFRRGYATTSGQNPNFNKAKRKGRPKLYPWDEMTKLGDMFLVKNRSPSLVSVTVSMQNKKDPYRFFKRIPVAQGELVVLVGITGVDYKNVVE